MSGGRKKAVLRARDGTVTSAYIAADGFVDGNTLEALGLDGRTLHLPLKTLRWVAYVRDWHHGDPEPERLLRRVFLARPRVEGLWVRITFAPDDVLEGLAPLDLALLEGVRAQGGVMLLPPDTRSNTQRLFVPCAAMAGFQVMGVVTTPSKKPAPAARESGQLFPDHHPPERLR